MCVITRSHFVFFKVFILCVIRRSHCVRVIMRSDLVCCIRDSFCMCYKGVILYLL